MAPALTEGANPRRSGRARDATRGTGASKRVAIDGIALALSARMTNSCVTLISALGLGLLACATEPGIAQDGHGQIPQPTPGEGKTDSADGAEHTFVSATVSGAEQVTLDTRLTPYVPTWRLDNVLIYGCENWNFRDGKQGLEIELTELVHSSFTVDGADPTRSRSRLDVYIAPPYHGAGDYRAEGAFSPSSDAVVAGRRYAAGDGCTVHVTEGTALTGTYSCTLPSASGTTVDVTGSFSCPGLGDDLPNFVAWTPPSS